MTTSALPQCCTIVINSFFFVLPAWRQQVSCIGQSKDLVFPAVLSKRSCVFPRFVHMVQGVAVISLTLFCVTTQATFQVMCEHLLCSDKPKTAE